MHYIPPVTHEAITVNEVVARNMTRLRKARGWQQKDLAERLEARTGEKWPDYTISRAESGQRSFSVDELTALCRVFQVPIFELFVVEDKSTQVDLGLSAVSADDYHQLIFWLPTETMRQLTGSLYGGFDDDGETSYGTHHGYQWGWFRDLTRHLLDRGEISQDLLDQATKGYETYDDETGEPVWVGPPSPEDTRQARGQIRNAYRKVMGPESFDAVTNDPQFWLQASSRRYRRSKGWGTQLPDDFAQLITEIIRDEKGEN